MFKDLRTSCHCWDFSTATWVFRHPRWVEHLRQHRRVIKQNEPLQALVNSFQRGTQPPNVRHLLAPSTQLYRQAELVVKTRQTATILPLA